MLIKRAFKFKLKPTSADQKMPLEMREYDCQNCGKNRDHDYNSAIVLKAAGMSVLKACGAALNGGSVEARIFRL